MAIKHKSQSAPGTGDDFIDALKGPIMPWYTGLPDQLEEFALEAKRHEARYRDNPVLANGFKTRLALHLIDYLVLAEATNRLDEFDKILAKHAYPYAKFFIDCIDLIFPENPALPDSYAIRSGRSPNHDAVHLHSNYDVIPAYDNGKQRGWSIVAKGSHSRMAAAK